MKKQYLHIILIIITLSISLTLPVKAVQPVSTEFKSQTIQTEHKLEENLTLKQKIALKLIEKKIKKAKKKSTQNDCATLVLKNQKREKIKIIRLSDKELIYRKCGEEKGELTISLELIKYIRAKDGQVIYSTGRGPTDPLSIASLISGIAGIIIAFSGILTLGILISLFGVIAGIISLFRISKSKGKSSGKVWAILGIIFGSIIGVIFPAIILFYGFA